MEAPTPKGAVQVSERHQIWADNETEEVIFIRMKLMLQLPFLFSQDVLATDFSFI
jgi:hypothetical protein